MAMVQYVHSHMKPTELELREAYYAGASIPSLCRKYQVRNSTLAKWFAEYNISKVSYTNRRPYPEISDVQKELVLGTMLGDGCIVMKGPQAYMRITHSLKQSEYLNHKRSMLSGIYSGTVVVNSKAHQSGNDRFPDHQSQAIYTIVHPWLTEMRALMYKDGRKSIVKEWLDALQPLSLAYWFMDDGVASYSRGLYTMRFATYSFNYEEHLLIRQYFQSLGIDAVVSKYKAGKHYLRFNTSASKRLRDMIAPHIIKSMQYKIDPQAWMRRNNGRD